MLGREPAQSQETATLLTLALALGTRLTVYVIDALAVASARGFYLHVCELRHIISLLWVSVTLIYK